MANQNSSSGTYGNDLHASFAAYVGDDESLSIVRGWAARQGYASDIVYQGGPDMFAQALETTTPPQLAVVDIDGQLDPVGAVSRLITLCGSSSKVIAIGSANDVGLYRRMLGCGAVDYLVKPLTPDTLNQVLQAAIRGGRNTQGDVKEAKIVVVIGVRGGIGASTIATNTGWLLSHELGYHCALLDLDLQFGTSALALDLQPGRGLRDIVSSPHRVDALMITGSIVAESERYAILASEEPIDEPVTVEGTAITALLGEMRHTYDFIIVDLPRHLLGSQRRLLVAAQSIIIVSELSLAGIRDTLRVKTVLGDLGSSASIKCITSRIHAARPGQVDAGAFEKGAQIRIDGIIPEDVKAVTEAANSGKALGEIAKTAPITKALINLCHMISGTEVTRDKKQNGLIQKILATVHPRKMRGKS